MKKILITTLCTVLLVSVTGVNVKAEGLPDTKAAVMAEKEEITYARGVESELLKTVDYTLLETEDGWKVQLPKTAETEQIGTGDLVILPADGEGTCGTALAVKKIGEDAEGNLLWSCEEQEDLFWIVESLDISGTETFLSEEVPAGGNSFRARGIGINAENQLTEAGRIDYCFSNTMLSDAAELNGTVSIAISSIVYRLKMDVGVQNTTVEDFYFEVNHTVDVSADFSLHTNGKSGGEIMLGTVPFMLGGSGINGEITFWLTYDVNGNVTVDYRFSNRAGILLKDGSYVPFAENCSMAANALGMQFSAGPKMRFFLKFGKSINLLDITIDSGLAGDVSAVLSGGNTVEAGYGLDMWLYMNMKPEGKSIVSSALGLKPESIWDYESSPFHWVMDESWQNR